MKSFKEFILEHKSIVQIDTTGYDVSIPTIKAELNRNIDLVLSQQFVTIDEALNKVRKILSLYNLNLPQILIEPKKFDTIISTVGYNHTVFDEFGGELAEVSPISFTFNYKLESGLYSCSGEID